MVILAPPKMTAEEFFKLHGSESNVDLIGGEVVRYPLSGFHHGVVCSNAGSVIHGFVKANKLGRTMSNTHIRLSAETVLGADVCFVSYAKLPPGTSPDGMLEVVPDLVVEVRSPSDLWTEALSKMLDYLRRGVPVVVILDPPTESASVFRTGTRQDTFEKHQTLTLPDVLPGFEVPVSRFFEE